MQRLHPTAEAAERAFYAAMAEADLDRMMALWADDDAAVCNHPGGPRLIGCDAIRASFREIFRGGGVRIATAAVHAWRTPDVAVHSLIERIVVEGREGAELIEVVATNVFVRTPGGWRILVHHAGVADPSDADDDDLDEADDDGPEARETGAGQPVRIALRLGTDRTDADEEEPAESGPRRPPHRRLLH